MSLIRDALTPSRIAGFAIAAAMLLGAFFGVAASDVHAGYARGFWMLLTVGFALGCFALIWLSRPEDGAPLGAILPLAAHWIGVFTAVRIVYWFIETDHFTDAGAGLANGIVFALGTWMAGVHLEPRIAVIGAAIAGAVAVEALIQENLWTLFLLALLALAAMAVVRPALRRLARLFGGASDPA
ncbi:MAG: hypothetical protein AAGI51_03975 [Pseudomonadota bacterium]